MARRFAASTLAAAVALTLFASQALTAAEIFVSDDGRNFQLHGTITRADVARFRHVAAIIKAGDLPPSVSLDSNGGDVFAAIEIGRQIRANSMWTAMNGRCVSACVFLFAAGIFRTPSVPPDGPIIGTGDDLVTGIGIHRPYATDVDASTRAETDRRYKQLDALVRAYFKEMNISDSLADDMLRIPPEDVKFLTMGDVRRYGLNGVDPAYADLDASRNAKRYGISKQEYFRRFNLLKRECDTQLRDALLDRGSPAESMAKMRSFKSCGEDVMHGKR